MSEHGWVGGQCVHPVIHASTHTHTHTQRVRSNGREQVSPDTCLPDKCLTASSAPPPAAGWPRPQRPGPAASQEFEVSRAIEGSTVFLR